MLTDNCKNCASRCEHAGKDREFICPKGISCKVTNVSNAQRIRAMTDEELAKFLIKAHDGDMYIGFCQNKPECNEMLDAGTDIPEEACVACVVSWLQRPAEVEFR